MSGKISIAVAVIGAGPVGAALACRLAAAGMRVAVIDRSPLPPMEHPDFDGRVYAIAAGSQPFLDAATVWAVLPYAPCPILDIRVSDGRVGQRASPLYLHFNHREAGAGPFGWIVEARSLRLALNARLSALPEVLVFAPANAAVSREEAGAEVTIEGGPRIACRLVVAADGRSSQLREAAGIGTTRIDYRQSSVVCAIAHERGHRNTALEHFLPGGPFAQLPMSGLAEAPNVSGIVFTEHKALAERLIALAPTEFTREVARRLGPHLGAVRLIGRRWCYPLSAMLAERYIATRLALVGDAAHGIHPIAGQGLNLGLQDAAVLADLLLEGGDPGAPGLLARYQAGRRGPNLMMLAATDALDRLFSNDLGAVRLVRDLGIAAVDRIAPLKRLFMRRAMGLALFG